MISYERLIEISKIFSDYTFKYIKVTGGEPTLHPEFEKISNNIRKLFSAGWYEMATNGALLEKYLDTAKNYDHIILSRYPGENDEIFDLIKNDTSLPGYDLLDRDGELSFCDVFEKYPEEYLKIDYCVYSKSVVLYHDRIAACCGRMIGNCVNNGFNYDDFSVPIDTHWVENLITLRSRMKPICDVCWTKVHKAEYIKFETPRIDDPILLTKLELQNNPQEKKFICLQTFIKFDWVKILLGKDAWQPNVSPMEPGDISNEKNISLIQSCYLSPWFDIPFTQEQTFRFNFSFTEDHIVPFFVFIEDINYVPLLRCRCNVKEGCWEWTVTLNKPRERIRLKIMSDDFFTIVLPIFVTIFTDMRSIDFMKLKNRESDARKLQVNLDETAARLEEKTAEYERVVQTNNDYNQQLQALQGSRSYRTGRFFTWLPRKIRDFLFSKNKH
jgi:hypothetical protein